MTDPIHYSHKGRDWRHFAQVDLPLGTIDSVTIGERLETWLTDALHPLSLPLDYSRKIIASLCQATDSVQAESKHLRVLVFTQAKLSMPGQMWGFFRTEKLETVPTDSAKRIHVLAFYLYEEGSPTPD